jgi:hypothetical protein|nr:MAG TPA: hypothetical protein [Caudoviricetes sp.]
MNKEEAIQAMQAGLKVTHRHFTPDEWMTMRMGMMVLEDGVVCTPQEFWQWRTDSVWDNGYKLFGE